MLPTQSLRAAWNVLPSTVRRARAPSSQTEQGALGVSQTVRPGSPSLVRRTSRGGREGVGFCFGSRRGPTLLPPVSSLDPSRARKRGAEWGGPQDLTSCLPSTAVTCLVEMIPGDQVPLLWEAMCSEKGDKHMPVSAPPSLGWPRPPHPHRWPPVHSCD